MGGRLEAACYGAGLESAGGLVLLLMHIHIHPFAIIHRESLAFSGTILAGMENESLGEHGLPGEKSVQE